MLKRRTQPMIDGKSYRPPNISLKVFRKCDKDETNSSFYSKKAKAIVSFCTRGYTREVSNTDKRVKQRNYKNCAKKFFAVENKFTQTVECLIFIPL